MLPDADLLRRSIEDPSQFTGIFDRHHSAIFRYVRHCLDGQAAEDLAAETFTRAFAARGRYAATGSDARPWLFRIATNLVRDEVRRRRRADALGARLNGVRADTTDDPDHPDPELHAALMRLREPEREVLVLYAWAELSYEEIAEAVDVAVGTVRSRLSRARSRLRAELAPCTSSVGGHIDG